MTQASASDPALLVAKLHRVAVEESQSGYGHLLGYSPISLDHEPVEPLARVPTSSFVQRVLERELRVRAANDANERECANQWEWWCDGAAKWLSDLCEDN